MGNEDPFGRTVVVLPDITSDVLKQSLRILYVGEETFSFIKTPWDTVQAIIDVFERIFNIKWKLSEVDEESLKTKANDNKSKKRKNELADKKGKSAKKANVDENTESTASLYTEARKNVLKLQSFLSNNGSEDHSENTKLGKKSTEENSSESSPESCNEHPNGTAQANSNNKQTNIEIEKS